MSAGKYSSPGLNSSGEGGERETVPEGVFDARCYQIIDLGVQETPFTDDDGMKINQPKVMFGWEILEAGTRREDGKPFTISQEYTNSIGDKANLRKVLESWRGKKFTPEELKSFSLPTVLGAYCQVQVLHKISVGKGNTYATVANVMPIKGEKPEAINPNLAFSTSEWDTEIFESLPKYTQAKITSSLTYRYEIEGKLHNPSAPTGQTKDVVIEDISDDPIDLSEIPF